MKAKHSYNISHMLNHAIEQERTSCICLGLERVTHCLEYFGNPQKKFKSVLIGGTNGKGSTTFYLSNLACRLTDYKIARYISPHLISWEERFLINETNLDSFYISSYFEEVLRTIKSYESRSKLKLTLFELYTVFAFLLFAKEKADIAFLEVGLGGRLDATNVVETSDVLCSVITNVDLDHLNFLGDTIEKITFEKAGIIKPNNNVLTGTTGVALGILTKAANVRAAKLFNVLSVSEHEKMTYKEKNIKLALRTWEVVSEKLNLPFKNKENARKFLTSLQFTGRFQWFKNYKTLLDGAHNPAGAAELKKMLDIEFKGKNIIYILGMLDKDYNNFILNLIPPGSTVICTQPVSDRATKKELLAESIKKYGSFPVLENSLLESLNTAQKLNHDLIVIAGSLYLVGEALNLIHTRQQKERETYETRFQTAGI